MGLYGGSFVIWGPGGGDLLPGVIEELLDEPLEKEGPGEDDRRGGVREGEWSCVWVEGGHATIRIEHAGGGNGCGGWDGGDLSTSS